MSKALDRQREKLALKVEQMGMQGFGTLAIAAAIRSQRKKEMSPQGKLAAGLHEEILAVIHKYDETMILPTVLGILDLVKTQLVEEHLEDDDEDL